MKFLFFSSIGLMLCPMPSNAQVLMGNIVDESNKSLEGAVIYWMESQTGTSSNQNGYFKIDRAEGDLHLILSLTGYRKDTILVDRQSSYEMFVLREGILLNQVNVESQRQSNSFSRLEPLNIESLEKKEFKKAACCSLSESFQTSNAVDVSYTNASTGTKEIQFLGLRGLYSHFLIENREAFGGILSSTALDLIPGTWLDKVNIQKGASDVKSGAQSMTGAINVQLKKPFEDYPIFVNLFSDLHGRFESNIHLNKKWSEASSSGIYFNLGSLSTKKDHNGDSFIDEPSLQRINTMIRNIFFGHKMEGQINAQIVYEDRSGGQLFKDNAYDISQNIRHYNLSGNLGYVDFENEFQNIGSIYNLSRSEIKSSFGGKSFNADENRAGIQLLYNHPFGDGRHQVVLGPQFDYHKASEEFSTVLKQDYEEKIASVFSEYTFRNNMHLDNKLTITAGLRADWLIDDQLMLIPRASLRYLFADDWTFRASAGRGYRHGRLFSDHLFYFASSKIWNITTNNFLEKSWNTGFNIVGKPYIDGKELQVNFDFYKTWFQQQTILDLDQDYSSINVYDLDGKSNAIQFIATISYPVIDWLNVKLGMKYTDTKSQYKGGYRSVPMVPKYRGLVSVDVESENKKWLWNISSNYVGKMRLPDKNSVPHELIHEHDGSSEPYILVQSQLTYTSRSWEFYAGCENILDKTQHNAIIDAQNPFGPYFNAAEMYAPVSGIKPYVGLKWKIFN